MQKEETVYQIIVDENDLISKEEYDSLEVDGRSVIEVEYKEVKDKNGKD